MSEYWVSQERYWCEYCKTWLSDNKATRDMHENGARHKEAKAEALKDMRVANRKRQKEQEEQLTEMERIERAALAAMKKDVEAGVGGYKTATVNSYEKKESDRAAKEEAERQERLREKAEAEAARLAAEADAKGTGMGEWEAVDETEHVHEVYTEPAAVPAVVAVIEEDEEEEARIKLDVERTIEDLDRPNGMVGIGSDGGDGGEGDVKPVVMKKRKRGKIRSGIRKRKAVEE